MTADVWWESLSSALQYPFMQRALLAGGLIGLIASFYGVFVVQRGLSFLGNGLSHAAFGGIALGLLLGIHPLMVAVPFTVAVSLSIHALQTRTRLSGDTAIGIFFAVSMALGILFVSFKRQFTADAFAYLFGSILAVDETSLLLTFGLFILTLVNIKFWSPWAYATFDRDMALADRIPVQRHDYWLSVLIAITVVAASKVVGIVLIAAFLVIPAATARLLSSRFEQMTVLSVMIGVSSTFLGLLGSYVLDLPSGPVIILLQAMLFFVGVLFSKRA
jgi:zinc transport system permease protein